MTGKEIIVYGVDWCPDCTRVRRFFDRKKIAYHWIDVDQDPQAEKIVLQINHGLRSVPTIIFPDTSIMVEPSTREVAEKIKTLQQE